MKMQPGYMRRVVDETGPNEGHENLLEIKVYAESIATMIDKTGIG